MNKYPPVRERKASGVTAKRPTELLYFFSAIARTLAMTDAVKTSDSERWVRIHWFQFHAAPGENVRSAYAGDSVEQCNSAHSPDRQT